MALGLSKSTRSKRSDGLPRQVRGYEVVDFLGEGAGSIIYAVSDPRTSQIFALKHVVVRTPRDQRFIVQLENEFEVGSKVKHPLLRRYIDVKVIRRLFRHASEAVLVMEMVEGTNCEHNPPSDVKVIADIFHQTAEALGAMHARGFVHCDLKPQNILVSAAGEVKVIDLGQACEIGAAKTRVQGTPDFMAPEQVRREPVSVQTDVYNLGAAFYWLLTRRKLPTLFTVKKGANSFLMANAVAPPHEINTNVPQNLSNLVMECVRTTPARRPANTEELCRRLEIIQHTMRARKAQ
jgi:serine/threonine protein kinase